MAHVLEFSIVMFESEFCEEPTAYPYGTSSLLVVVPLGQTLRMLDRIREWQREWQRGLFERMEPHGSVS